MHGLGYLTLTLGCALERSIGEAVVYSGAAVAEIAAGNLAYATTHYGISWYALRLASAFHVQ